MSVEVSVILPVTRPKLAAKAIYSVRQQAQLGVNLEILTVVGKGLNPGKARNQGVTKAKGKIILFLDDDCQADKGWLKDNLTALKDPAVGAVGGRVIGRSQKYFARCVDLANFGWVQGGSRRALPLCAASLGVKRTIFEKVGGFDEAMAVGEDVDFCFRVNALGYQTIYEPKIKIYHEHGRDTLRQLVAYQFRNGRQKGLIIEKRYADNWQFILLRAIGRPLLYPWFILPLSILASWQAIIANREQGWPVIKLWPGVWLGKLACHIGIWFWLLKARKPSRHFFDR